MVSEVVNVVVSVVVSVVTDVFILVVVNVMTSLVSVIVFSVVVGVFFNFFFIIFSRTGQCSFIYVFFVVVVSIVVNVQNDDIAIDCIIITHTLFKLGYVDH